MLLLAVLTAGTAVKDKSFYPPGTVRISDSLYYDCTEVSNFMWLEYMYWLREEYGADAPQVKASLPDTLIWRRKGAQLESYTEFYLRHSNFSSFPVVGVSHKQARAYCNWRTTRVLAYETERLKKLGLTPTTYFKYRLPTEAEWKMVAEAGYSKKVAKKLKSKKYRNKPKLNSYDEIQMRANPNSPFQGSPTLSVHAFWPNTYGIYNLFGNVAEMVAEEGVAKGGGWVHDKEEMKLNEDFTYRGPEVWLGFRCVCEVR